MNLFLFQPEESEPMLKNSPHVPSIEPTSARNTRDNNIRHPVSRSPVRLFSLPSNSSPSTSGATSSGKKVTPLNTLVNSNDHATRENVKTVECESVNDQREHIHQLSHNRSPVRHLETGVHHPSSQLCQVCIPLTSITSTSVPSSNQVVCYLCNSPTPGHLSSDRATTLDQRHTLDSMARVTTSPGPTLIPKSSNMPLDMNIYATRKTIAQGNTRSHYFE